MLTQLCANLYIQGLISKDQWQDAIATGTPVRAATTAIFCAKANAASFPTQTAMDLAASTAEVAVPTSTAAATPAIVKVHVLNKANRVALPLMHV